MAPCKSAVAVAIIAFAGQALGSETAGAGLTLRDAIHENPDFLSLRDDASLDLDVRGIEDADLALNEERDLEERGTSGYIQKGKGKGNSGGGGAIDAIGQLTASKKGRRDLEERKFKGKGRIDQHMLGAHALSGIRARDLEERGTGAIGKHKFQGGGSIADAIGGVKKGRRNLEERKIGTNPARPGHNFMFHSGVRARDLEERGTGAIGKHKSQGGGSGGGSIVDAIGGVKKGRRDLEQRKIKPTQHRPGLSVMHLTGIRARDLEGRGTSGCIQKGKGKGNSGGGTAAIDGIQVPHRKGKRGFNHVRMRGKNPRSLRKTRRGGFSTAAGRSI